MFCCLAPFSNQLVNEGGAWFYMLPDETLRSLDASFQRRDPEFVIFKA
jgi:hypothetical protein